MNLLLFSIVMLSTCFTVILGFWWDSAAPFKIHLSALGVLLALLVSIILIITVSPLVSRRFSDAMKGKNFDSGAWGHDISNKIFTPAAVIDDLNIKFANNAFLKSLGLSGMQEFIINMPLTNLIHPGSHNALNNYVSQLHDQQTDEAVGLRMLYVDGTTIPVQITLSHLNSDDASNLYLLQLTVNNLSPTSSAKTSNDFNQTLIDNIQQIVFQIDVEQKLIFLNTSWQHFLDYSIDESIETPFIKYIHPEEQAMVEARLNSLTEGKRQQTQFELRLICRNGTSIWMEIRATTTSKVKGERTSIIGTLTDISRMKSIEASLKSNSQTKIPHLLTDIPCMLYTCKNDRNWTFDYVSDGCQEVTEFQPYELTNSLNFNYMQLILPEDQARVWEHVQKQISKQRSYQIIYRIVTRSNQIKWVMERGKGVFSSTEELLTLQGIIIDLSSDDFTEMQQGLQNLIASSEKS